jgi:hypothetical protein
VRVPGEVFNGGFEQTLEGWSADPSTPDSAVADSSAAKAGKVCLRLVAARPGVTAAVSQELLLPGTAGHLSLSLWLRPTLAGPARLVARLELLDANKTVLARRYLQGVPTDPRNWDQLSGVLEIPAQAVAARLTLRLVATGAIWVDEVKSRFDPAKLLFVPRRIACVEGQPAKITLTPWVRLQAQPTATIDKKDATVTPQGEDLQIDVPALTRGLHALELIAEGARDAIDLWAVPPGHRSRQVSDSGWWLLNGKPALPSIMMHAMLADVPPLAGDGFNMAELLAPPSAEALMKALKPLPRLEVPLLVGFGAPPTAKVEDWRANVLHSIRNNAADLRLGGWIIAYEPDSVLNNREIPSLCLDACSSDSSHAFVVTIASPDQADFWCKFADVVLVNLGYSGSDPARVCALLRDAAGKLDKGKVLGAILPAGWQAGSFQPDAAQARLLAFSAIAGGARCLAWYALHATGWDLRSTPLWAGLRDLNRDLAILGAAVAGRDPASDVTVDAPPMPWIAWADGETRILLAVNVQKDPATVKVKAAQPIRSASAMLYRTTTEVADGAAQMTLQPGAVAVVRLGFTAPAAPAAAQPAAPAALTPDAKPAPPPPPAK